jgi:hypothetical protein
MVWLTLVDEDIQNALTHRAAMQVSTFPVVKLELSSGHLKKTPILNVNCRMRPGLLLSRLVVCQ